MCIRDRAKADQALQVQIDALKKFEEATGKKFDSLQGQLDAMKKELANLGSKEEIENLLKKANEEMQKEVSDQLNTLLGCLLYTSRHSYQFFRILSQPFSRHGHSGDKPTLEHRRGILPPFPVGSLFSDADGGTTG